MFTSGSHGGKGGRTWFYRGEVEAAAFGVAVAAFGWFVPRLVDAGDGGSIRRHHGGNRVVHDSLSRCWRRRRGEAEPVLGSHVGRVNLRHVVIFEVQDVGAKQCHSSRPSGGLASRRFQWKRSVGAQLDNGPTAFGAPFLWWATRSAAGADGGGGARRWWQKVVVRETAWRLWNRSAGR